MEADGVPLGDDEDEDEEGKTLDELLQSSVQTSSAGVMAKAMTAPDDIKENVTSQALPAL